jgi:hypothetical protein
MAKKYIDMALKVGGDRADLFRANLAGIYYSSDRFEEAETVLGSIERKDARTICSLARVLGTEGKMEQAAGLIEKFLSGERFAAAPRADGDPALQEVVARGADCLSNAALMTRSISWKSIRGCSLRSRGPWRISTPGSIFCRRRTTASPRWAACPRR